MNSPAPGCVGGAAGEGSGVRVGGSGGGGAEAWNSRVNSPGADGVGGDAGVGGGGGAASPMG